jgi:phospholipid/cholesterol/gamma-HCH transport system substrate-binding protein
LAAKQQQVSDVLSAARSLVQTLNQNSGALVGLLVQGQQFLHLVVQRHALVDQLLRDTAQLGNQLRTLMQHNRSQLNTFLASIDSVSKLLVREKRQLQQSIVYLGQFGVNITNVTGAGPWLDLLTPSVVVPDNQIVGCGTDPAADKKPCGP